MSLILRLLGGSGGVWVLVGTLLVTAAASAGAAVWATSSVMHGQVADAQKETSDQKLLTEQCKTKRETDRANQNQQTVKDLVASVANALTENQHTAEQRDSERQKTAKLLKELNNAPKTAACAASPAFRAYLNSVQ